MSSSRLVRIPILALLAMALSPAADAKPSQSQNAEGPAADSARAREFIAALTAGMCTVAGCTVCNPAQQTSDQSAAAESTATEGQGESSGQAAQETLVASGGISQSACRAVGLTDSDTGEAAQIKGTAAALITGLEDLRDSLYPGSGDRLTAEGQIGAVAQACSWAVSRLTKQAV